MRAFKISKEMCNSRFRFHSGYVLKSKNASKNQSQNLQKSIKNPPKLSPKWSKIDAGAASGPSWALLGRSGVVGGGP